VRSGGNPGVTTLFTTFSRVTVGQLRDAAWLFVSRIAVATESPALNSLPRGMPGRTAARCSAGLELRAYDSGGVGGEALRLGRFIPYSLPR
jgi:hypothetical protein